MNEGAPLVGDVGQGPAPNKTLAWTRFFGPRRPTSGVRMGYSCSAPRDVRDPMGVGISRSAKCAGSLWMWVTPASRDVRDPMGVGISRTTDEHVCRVAGGSGVWRGLEMARKCDVGVPRA